MPINRNRRIENQFRAAKNGLKSFVFFFWIVLHFIWRRVFFVSFFFCCCWKFKFQYYVLSRWSLLSVILLVFFRQGLYWTVLCFKWKIMLRCEQTGVYLLNSNFFFCSRKTKIDYKQFGVSCLHYIHKI